MSEALLWALAIALELGLTGFGLWYLKKNEICARRGATLYALICLAALAAGLIWRRPSRATLGYYALVPLAMLIAFEDVRSHRIANRLLLILLVLGTLVLPLDFSRCVSKVAAMVVYGGVFVLVSLLSKGGFGMGDAKMLGVVALFFGLFEMFTALFATSVVACALGIVKAVRSRSLKQEVAFAPSIAAGILLALIWVV